ncbi:MAG: outer membrane protein OmpA-like peptidoglycan-associated protein [Flavobacteriaceae bacterium]|jgi:outer membrane protein OmpA-like peptidoglycan-associated protein|uniref:OmpA family protein n=1 Tax=Candidatus Marifrigoribacter sp. Uisw_064 TaxID=3230970 RepID=UPI003AE87725
MKKIYILFLILVVSASVVTAQNEKTKKADQLYDRLAYTNAAEAYQKLIKKGKGTAYVFERLANCYYFINDTKKSETYYKRAVKGNKYSAETVYNYAQSLKSNGKYSDHNTWMKKFAEMSPNDSRATKFMKNPNYVPKILDGAKNYTASNMKDINTEYSEFGGTVLGNKFYFSSARNKSRKKYKWNDQPYLDIYIADVIGGGVKNASLLEGDINSKYHEGNVAISADGKRMYFDRNDFYEGKYKKSEDGINQINLYYAEKIDGEWKGVRSVNFNSHEYSTGQPALSSDGNTLYFVSDKSGGKGMSDIYKVAIKKDGSLGTPEILGGDINTEGKEVFPYVDEAGTLYFSSDGHLGVGGLDVFSAEASGNNFGSVTNMGSGINSPSDDFAFKYNSTSQEGYVSSDRKGSIGSDDIFQIKRIEEECEVAINVQVVNDLTNAPLGGVRVELYDAFENKLSTKTTDNDGRATLLAECEKEHIIQGYLQDYESNAVTVASTKEKEVNTTLRLRPIEEIIVDEKVVLNPILFDFDKHNIKAQAAFELDKLVAIMQKYPAMIIEVESHTDNIASDDYNNKLSERRAQSTVQYVISKGIETSKISGKGFGENSPVEKCGANCTDAQHQLNRRSEFLIIKK